MLCLSISREMYMRRRHRQAEHLYLNASRMATPKLSGGNEGSIGDFAKFGVITVSDRASGGIYEDQSGPAILQFFTEAVESKWEAIYKVIPDEQPVIEQTIIDMVSVPSRCKRLQPGYSMMVMANLAKKHREMSEYMHAGYDIQ